MIHRCDDTNDSSFSSNIFLHVLLALLNNSVSILKSDSFSERGIAAALESHQIASSQIIVS